MMKHSLLLCLLLPVLAWGQEWHSGAAQTDLVELYTSEGCSSCPPAEKWFSTLKGKPGLFRDFVPVAFHVDYWNGIGWKDPFSSSIYSERQRRYVREGLVSQVYTPGFVINSDEWRGWFRGQRKWQGSDKTPGVLSAHLDGNRLTATFAQQEPLVLTVAYLGMGLSQQVEAGENSGRKLVHDFVVLNLVSGEGEGEWNFRLPPVPDAGQHRTALAVWVSPRDSQQVLQAVGGYLPAGH